MAELYEYLAADHDRLDGLLQRAAATPGVIDMELYGEFRKGLLRHIGIEERIVLPTIAMLQEGRQADIAERLRLDHGALAALMVPPPSPAIIATIRSILAVHNVLEEGEGGLYALLETLALSDAEALLSKMRRTPDVPVMPHNGRPEVMHATRRALQRAGYELKDTPG